MHFFYPKYARRPGEQQTFLKVYTLIMAGQQVKCCFFEKNKGFLQQKHIWGCLINNRFSQASIA